MDIKSKSNKKISLLAVLVVAILFSAVFLSRYPQFAQNANGHYEDYIQGDSFLEGLYWANYVLYKDMAEQTDEKKYSYEELYLDIREETVPESYADDSLYAMDMDSSTFQKEFREYFNRFLAEKRTEVMNYTAQNMDYCVIDNQTGKTVKNTERNIELLARTGDEKEDLPYVYYVMSSYDSAGNFVSAAVKGSNSDELLKSVSRVMTSDLMVRQNEFMNHYSDGTGNFYAYDFLENGEAEYMPENGETQYMPENGEAEYTEEGYGEENKVTKMTVDIGAPENMTFIYALTQDQKDELVGAVYGGNDVLSLGWNQYYAYWQSGVAGSYMLMLAILTIVILLLMQFKWYCLYRGKIEQISIEIAVVAGVLMLMLFGEGSIYLVHAANSGYWDSVWRTLFEFLPTESYPFLTIAVNVVILSITFGLWIFCVNVLGGIKILGIKEFLKQRSIVIRSLRWIYRQSKRLWNRFKEELLHVDLGEKTEPMIRKVVIFNGLLLGLMCSLWLFGWFAIILYSIILYFFLKKYIQKLQGQYQKLLQATGSIAEGNLNTEFQEDLGIFESYKDELYKIQEGFRKAVDEEVKSQRMKTELITNVSHDLKTPLTAITTYIDLLKEENITEEQRREYIKVLEKKSLRLKTLIEDLFEVSKANSKSVTVNLVDVDICNLMRQVYLELEDKAEEANLIFRFRMPEERIVLKLDSQKTYRIFENLYANIMKYAMTGTRVYIGAEWEMTEEDADKNRNRKMLRIELKNMSARELEVAPEELTERFVRGDSSRNTEGSGLGLAIAKSFTELQGGRMEVTVDGDLFKVTIWLPSMI